MNTIEFLGLLRAEGICIALNDNDTVKVSAPSRLLSPDIKSELKHRKQDIVAFLKASRKAPDHPPGNLDATEHPGNEQRYASYSQERLWFIDKLKPGSVSYNMPFALWIEGSVSLPSLQQAITKLLTRQTALRSRFYENQEGALCVSLLPEDTIPLSVTSLSIADDTDLDEALRLGACAQADKPFDLEKGPLVRFEIIQVFSSSGAQQGIALLISLHHIIADGWSVNLLGKELLAHYLTLTHNAPVHLPDLPCTYRDYTDQQRKRLEQETFDNGLAFWRDYLSPMPAVATLPGDNTLNVNTDGALSDDESGKSSQQSSWGERYHFHIPADLSNSIKSYCRTNNLTLFMFMLTAYQILVAKYSKSDEVCIGIPSAGRDDPAAHNLIGLFANTLLTRAKVLKHLSVKDFLIDNKSSLLEVLANEDTPLHLLLRELDVKQEHRLQESLQLGFQLQNFGGLNDDTLQVSDGPVRLRQITLREMPVKYDLILSLSDHAKALGGYIEFRKSKYSEEYINRLCQQYYHILEQMTANDRAPIGTLELQPQDILLKDLCGNHTDAFGGCTEVIPLTENQSGIYYESILKPDTLNNSMGIPVRFSQPLSETVVAEALKRAGSMFEILRVSLVPGSQPYHDAVYMGVHNALTIAQDAYQCRDEDEANQLIDRLIYRTYNLMQEPLIRFSCIHISGSFSYLLLSTHHILLDGAGATRLMTAVVELILTGQIAHKHSQTESENLSTSVKRHTQSTDLPETVQYWRERLANTENLQLPELKNSTLFKPSECSNSAVILDPAVQQQIKAVCENLGVTENSFFNALYGVLLNACFSPQADFVVQHYYRGPRNSAIGCFYQQYPFLFQADSLQPDQSLANFIQHTEQQMNAIRPYRMLSRDQQTRIVPSGPISASYNYLGIELSGKFGNQSAEFFWRNPVVENMLQLAIKPMYGQLRIEFVADPKLFNAQQFLATYRQLIEAVLDNTQATLKQIRLFSAPDWGRTKPPLERNYLVSGVSQGISRAFGLFPKSTALRQGNRSLTYHELGENVGHRVSALMSLGVKEGQTVVLYGHPSIEYVVTLLALIKLRCTYVPVDSGQPVKRLEHIVQDANAGWIAYCDNEKPDTALEAIYQDRLITTDRLLDPPGHTAEPVASDLHANDINRCFYIVYTSGSTGKPKGVRISEESELNLLTWYCRACRFIPDNKTLIISSPGFDLTQKNFFAPLLTGGTLLLPDRHEYDPGAIAAQMLRDKVTHINSAPSLFYPVFNTLKSFKRKPPLKHVILGGEAINTALLKAWDNVVPGCKLHNTYGPSECTDIVACSVLESPASRNPNHLSQAVDNTRLSIQNMSGQPVPPGVTGEVVIEGLAVGLGYQSRQPDSGFAMNRAFNTGDLARYLDNGTIELTGRRDLQLKLNGVRISPEEIECQLRGFEGCNDCAVVVQRPPGSQPVLVAFIKTDKAIDDASIRHYLAERLPVAMIPSRILAISEWPLSLSGKIDRNQLLTHTDLDRRTTHEAPSSPMEETILGIWHEVLGQHGIGVTDNFFEIGGHSLQATRINARIRHQLHYNISLKDFFENSTIRQLAALIESTPSSETSLTITAQPRQAGTVLPLSFGQQQLWVVERLKRTAIVFSLPFALRFKGDLVPHWLDESLSTVISRHEILRSRFDIVDDKPGVIIDAPQPWRSELIDISDMPNDARENYLQSAISAERERDFDLKHGPLMRTRVYRCASDDWVLLLTLHHIIADGWSVNILAREIMACYRALASSTKPDLAPLPVQYTDYAIWQREQLSGDTLAKGISYWRDKLNHDYNEISLPVDYGEPSAPANQGHSVTCDISRDTLSQLKQFSETRNTTLFIVMLSIFKVLLQRYSGQKGVNVGTPVAGRHLQETESLIGLFANTVVISTPLNTDATFETLLSDVRTSVLEAFSYQQIPFEKIVAELKPPRASKRNPFYQVAFNLLNLPQDVQTIDDLRVTSLVQEEDKQRAKIDLNLYAHESRHGLHLKMVYNRAMFSRRRIERLFAHFNTLMRQVLANPTQPLKKYKAGKADNALSRPKEKFDTSELTHPLAAFYLNTQTRPDALCIATNDSRYSYHDTDHLSDLLASHFASSGIRKGDTIAILAQPCAQVVIAVLAAMKCNAVFSLVDASLPEPRQQLILDALAPELVYDTGAPVDAQEIQKSQPALNLSEPAYVVFTSGTTGTPKGVINDFQAIAHFFHWYQQTAGLSQNDRFSLLAGLSHDAAIRDILIPLFAGASLHIPDPATKTDPTLLYEWCLQERITTMHITPAFIRWLKAADTKTERLNALRNALVGGEKLLWSDAESLLVMAPGTSCFNVYGTTETPQVQTAFRLDAHTIESLKHHHASVPLGNGISAIHVSVVGATGEPVDIGEVGQIRVNSDFSHWGVITDSGWMKKHSPSYLTGDFGRYNEDGSIQYLGRMDRQLNIRGYRFHPDEIENQLLQLNGIDAAYVIPSASHTDSPGLKAYLQSTHPPEQMVRHVRDHVAANLPNYMWPTDILVAESLPMTANMKLDVQAADTLLHQQKRSEPHIDISTLDPMEKEVLAMWKGALNRDDIRLDDNFFDLGGNSLIAVTLLNKLKERFGNQIIIADLYQQLTVREQAAFLRANSHPEDEPQPETLARPRKSDNNKRTARRARRQQARSGSEV